MPQVGQALLGYIILYNFILYYIIYTHAYADYIAARVQAQVYKNPPDNAAIVMRQHQNNEINGPNARGKIVRGCCGWKVSLIANTFCREAKF